MNQRSLRTNPASARPPTSAVWAAAHTQSLTTHPAPEGRTRSKDEGDRGGRKSVRQALLEAITHRKGETAKSGEVIEEAVANTVPPLAGRTPKATAAAQLVYLVRDGLVVRKGKGFVALALVRVIESLDHDAGRRVPASVVEPNLNTVAAQGCPSGDQGGGEALHALLLRRLHLQPGYFGRSLGRLRLAVGHAFQQDRTVHLRQNGGDPDPEDDPVRDAEPAGAFQHERTVRPPGRALGAVRT